MKRERVNIVDRWFLLAVINIHKITITKPTKTGENVTQKSLKSRGSFLKFCPENSTIIIIVSFSNSN